MNTFAFIENINGPEMILIFLVVLLLFGAERLPGLFKSLGQSVREFKRATRGIEEDIRTAMDVEPERVTPRSAPKSVPVEAQPEVEVAESTAAEPVESEAVKREV